MLYEIDGKFYVLASNKYREVKVEKDLNGAFDVKVIEKSEPIEKTPKIREKAQPISVEEAYARRNRNKGIE